jgi:hypothetical protein
VDLPSAEGVWSHDVAEITMAQDGIDPRDGSRMLHFIYTSPYGPLWSYECEVWQLYDTAGFADLILSGGATAVGSAWFNRVAGDSQTDTQFAIEIRAYAGELSTFPSQLTFTDLDLLEQTLVSDADPATWESAEVHFPIPSETDFLALRVIAREDVYNDETGTELDGHYADDVSLTIVPEPAGLCLLALGGLAVLRSSRRK